MPAFLCRLRTAIPGRQADIGPAQKEFEPFPLEILGDMLRTLGEAPTATTADLDRLAAVFDSYCNACKTMDADSHGNPKAVRRSAQKLLEQYRPIHALIQKELGRRTSSSFDGKRKPTSNKDLMRSYGKLKASYGKLKNELRYVDVRGVMEDPVEAFRRSGGWPVLIDVPLEKVRNLGPLAFPVARHGGDPYVATAREYLDGHCCCYRGSWLEWFYARWTPSTAAAVLGLSEQEAPAVLVECPAHSFVYPWAGSDPVRKDQRKLEAIRMENLQRGAELQGEEGYVYFGPLSEAKGDLEFSRLRQVADSVRSEGFQISKSTINGQLLVRGKDWCIIRGGGNHRRAVLAALGWTHGPIRVKGQVRREEVGSWRNVRSGLFTEAQALQVFDRMFEGRQPAGCPSVTDAVSSGDRPVA